MHRKPKSKVTHRIRCKLMDSQMVVSRCQHWDRLAVACHQADLKLILDPTDDCTCRLKEVEGVKFRNTKHHLLSIVGK